MSANDAAISPASPAPGAALNYVTLKLDARRANGRRSAAVEPRVRIRWCAAIRGDNAAIIPADLTADGGDRGIMHG
jgi:hypothetical protein